MTKILLSVLIITAVLVGGYFGYKEISQTPEGKTTPASTITPVTSPGNQELKTFKSKNIQFAVQVPKNFEVQEKIAYVDLISSVGRINLSRNATNFDSIKDYLNDFDSKREVEVSNEVIINIGAYDSIKRIENFNIGPIDEQNLYFIYVDNWVYSISTSTQSLYPVLDQIAQSFRYIP